jgi:hypothetical protein
MTKNTYVNKDGFNPDFSTYQDNISRQYTVFLIQGMPWSEAAGVLRSGYAWQVSPNARRAGRSVVLALM